MVSIEVHLCSVDFNIADGKGSVSGEIISKYQPAEGLELTSITLCAFQDVVLIGELATETGTEWFWLDCDLKTGARFTSRKIYLQSLEEEFSMTKPPPLGKCKKIYDDYWEGRWD